VATAQTESARAAGLTKQPLAERLVSLDAFRGAIIALMVLVNDPGDGRNVYGSLNHAEWNGWTITDVVFPSFLWIVGVAMTFSMAKKLAAGNSRGQIFMQVLRRAAILYALGLFLYALPKFDLSTLRILGVLQRIAICYAIAAAIYLTTGVRGQIIWIVSLLTAFWLIMIFAPVPGIGSGYLDVERNFAHYVDSIILGHHNYHRTKTWDPEGIVSTLPAIATALLGILAGTLLRTKRALAERTTWMFVAGNLLIAASLICDILAADQQEDLDQLVRAVHGGPRFRDAGHRGLAGGRHGLSPGREAGSDHGNERHRRVHGVGSSGRDAAHHPLELGRFGACVDL